MADSDYQVGPAKSRKWQKEVQELVDMGFPKQKAFSTLEETNGDISAALGRLLA